MKKFLIATGVAVFAFAAVAGAQTSTFSSNLTIGSTGAEVVALQTALINGGFNIPSIASGAAAKGYFGSQTQAAVKAYQTSKGIPSTGFVGPLTRGALNGAPVSSGTGSAVCPVGFTCTAVGGSTGSATLSGTDGTISDVNELSQYSNEEVGDGESDVKVAGFEVEASTDGDIAIKSVRLTFTQTNTTASRKLTDYVDSVSVWMGSTKIGTADASAFNKDSTGVYSKTIAVNNAVVKADKTEKIYVSVDAVNNLDSVDVANDVWSVEVASIRYEDGSGVTSTESSIGDMPVSVGFNFVNFSTAADTELKISTDSSSPDSSIVMVDDTNDTNNVVLLVGKMKLDGTSDVTLNELPITLTTAVGTTSLAAIANSVTLKINGEEFTKTVSTTTVSSATTTFDNLDLTIKAGSTVTFTVLADINDINPSTASSTDFNEGYVLKADLTSTNRALIDAENEEGDQLASGEKSGTAVGEYQEFRTQGIGLTLVSTATDATTGTSANDDVGLFTIKFKVTAFGDTVYVATTSAGYTYVVDKGGTTVSNASTSASVVNNTDTTVTSGRFMIEDGETEEITLSVSVPLGTLTSGQYRLSLTGVAWDTDTTSLDNNYTSELDTFKTAYKVLN